MDKEKQIEEMANIINEMDDCNAHYYDEYMIKCDAFADANAIAKVLYNAGYRKQSDNVIELLCKVGDTVYVPWRWAFQQGVATVRIEEIKFYDSQMHYMFFIDMESDNECFNQSFGGWKLGKSIGVSVFLTKEEAEKALAKMKGGE